MLQHRVLRIAELLELTAKELRAMAVDLGRSPAAAGGQPAVEPMDASTTSATGPRRGRRRAEDTLVRLEEYGYIREGTVIRLIARLLPLGADPLDPRFRAQVGRNPSKPVWLFDGEQLRSLTQLSKQLRDELGIGFPQSSFNANKFWCIEGEEPERTLESIAKQMVL